MGKSTTTFSFTDKASHPKNAVALIYDLTGFSQFFNQPDVQNYVPTFLNCVSEAMGICLFGGEAYWQSKNSKIVAPDVRVAHEKFTGDGALYILLPPSGSSDFKASELQYLCNSLWNLKRNFNKVVSRSLERVPVVEVPRGIRFGVSRGSVYELQKPGTVAREYIGFCINLASRLQSYCRDLGFIASARLMLSDKELTKHGYIKVIATQIRGFPSELVLVDNKEYTALSDETRSQLFRDPE
ncbi:hypothetical protein KAU37_00335 [Candidatus Bipolaricaulota bacterium]|nr:hypothetical protein [Candidatus Bipolaricaulota bacterium]